MELSFSACRECAHFAKRVAVMRLYKETGKAKTNRVCEYVGDLLDGGAKLLVFGHHMNVLDALEKMARSRKVDYIRIDGSTAAAIRQDLVSR
jgi:SWI/SNF-related matrix-associated actin-dependent regulator 1 of chromatin subfamily A